VWPPLRRKMMGRGRRGMLGAAQHRQQAGATLVAPATPVAPPPAMHQSGEASMGSHTVGVEQRAEWTIGEQTSRVPPKLVSEDLREGTCDET
jgi:hypothetical protein